MIKKIIISIFILSVGISIKGQDLLLSAYNHTILGEYDLADSDLGKFESMGLYEVNDSMKSVYFYVKGLLMENKGEIEQAMFSYLESCNYSEDADCIGNSYLENLYKIMQWHVTNNRYADCANVGMKATTISPTLLPTSLLTYEIYRTLINSLFQINKFANVPKIAHEGFIFSQRLFTPKDESFYEFPFNEAVAYIMMCKTEKADSILTAINSLFLSSGVTLPNVDKTIRELRMNNLESATNNWTSRKQRTKEILTKIGENMLLVSTTSPDGVSRWKQYLQTLRNTLELFYLDPSDADDESFWNWCLAQLILRFYICCEDLPNRECESYDNILLRKNFLEYHTGNLYKEPCTWKSVASMLNDKEVAIEISLIPDEVLILRRGSEKPTSIPVDSLLMEEISTTDVHDPLSINRLYDNGGLLSKLWATIEPHLNDVSTIYLSTNNLFNHFNFLAIPLNNDSLVSDKYLIRNVLSTADIKYVKDNKKEVLFKNAVLYGGIDYDINEKQMYEESQKYCNKNEGSQWSLTRGLPDDVRGKFNYLNASLPEVESIEKILQQGKTKTKVFSGASANEESFKELSNKNINLLHISTHGFMMAPLFNSDKANEIKKIVGNRYQTILSQSGLLLSGANHTWQGHEIQKGVEDGILTSKEISDLDLSSVKLAVLSACDTGLGENTNLTGASFGVQHAFKSAGVEKLLVCLWQVDDEATSTFMQLFYSNLSTSHNYYEALKYAKKSLIKKGFKDPYYWAPFVLIE